MTFDELNRTLSETRAGGKIGVPVSLRMHLQLSDRQADLVAALLAVIELARPLFGAQPSRLMARGVPGGPQLNVLASFTGGQTLLVTLGRGAVERATLELLLIGNHGVIRLEGAELFEEPLFAAPEGADRWKSWIDKSLQQNVSVDIPHDSLPVEKRL